MFAPYQVLPLYYQTITVVTPCTSGSDKALICYVVSALQLSCNAIEILTLVGTLNFLNGKKIQSI